MSYYNDSFEGNNSGYGLGVVDDSGTVKILNESEFGMQVWHKVTYRRTGADSCELLIDDGSTFSGVFNPRGDLMGDVSGATKPGGYFPDFIGKQLDRVNILFDFQGCSPFKFLSVENHTVTESTPVPRAVPRCSEQQGLASAFTGRANGSDLKRVFAQCHNNKEDYLLQILLSNCFGKAMPAPQRACSLACTFVNKYTMLING